MLSEKNTVRGLPLYIIECTENDIFVYFGQSGGIIATLLLTKCLPSRRTMAARAKVGLFSLTAREDFALLLFQFCGVDATVGLRGISKGFCQLLDHATELAGVWEFLFASSFPRHVIQEAKQRCFPNVTCWRNVAHFAVNFHALTSVCWKGRGPNDQPDEMSVGYGLFVPPHDSPAVELPRISHSMVALGDWVVVYGGFGGTSWGDDWGIQERSDPFVFHVATSSGRVHLAAPSESGDRPVPRYGQSLTSTLDPCNSGGEEACAIMFGGFSESYFSNCLSDLHSLHWKEGGVGKELEWRSIALKPRRWGDSGDQDTPVLQGRGCHGSAFDPRTKCLYIFGGIRDQHPIDEFLVINTVSWEWEPLWKHTVGQMPSPRYSSTLTYVNGRLFAFGGASGADFFNEGRDLCELYVFHIDSISWERVDIAPDPNFSSVQTSVLPSLTPAAPRLNETIGRGHTSVAMGSKIIVFGGFNLGRPNRFSPTSIISIFNTETLKWAETCNSANTDTPWERFGHAAVLHRGAMCVYGGWAQETRSNINDLHVLELCPANGSRADRIPDDDVEEDSQCIHPVTSIFYSMPSAKSLLDDARRRLRVGSARLRRKKRSCYQMCDQAVNYMSTGVFSLVAFVFALIPSLVAIAAWRLSRAAFGKKTK